MHYSLRLAIGMTPARIVSGGNDEETGKGGCKVVFPVAGPSADMLAQYSGRMLQKGCRKKLHLMIVQEREKEGISLPAPSRLLPLGQGLFCRASSPELPGGATWLLRSHSGN